MPRATNGPASRKRRKRILLRAKGFRGFRSKLFRYAKDAVYKAWQYEYRDRKRRKGQFRRLWIARISAAVRDRGLTYSRFMEGLKAANIDLDRKVLADLAVSDEKAFDAIFAQAKKAIEAKDGAALWSRCSHVHHLVRQPVSLIAASIFPCRLGKILFPPVRIFVKNTMAL